jgi:hypothetical protein
LKIVAFGSSSTSGAGASSPAANYPSRFEAELRRLLPGQSVTVLNRGKGGEQARHMLARLQTSVLDESPDLVLWQVGTNVVLRDAPLPLAWEQIGSGIRQMRARGIDVVLIDSQFAPKVIAKPHAAEMVRFLADTAKENRIGLFRRFDLMRRWVLDEQVPFSAFLSRDELHMNDWSYACVAKLLGIAIADAARRPVAATASARPAR